jgi:uncharacterized membrane protein
VLAKQADGKVSIKQGEDNGPLGTLANTAVGSLVGLLGGPVGVAVGAASGAFVGGTFDLINAGVGDDFIDDVSKQLGPNKVALVAEIDEDWTTPVDGRMEALGGRVFRRSVSEVKQTLHEENIAAIKADLAQMKAEHAKANADRKTKLQEKINQLDSKIEAQLKRAKEARENAQRQAQTKAQVLKTKAEAARAKAS